MADALCGPSNALQNFQKHSSVDRTLQQDRLTSRHSPSQGFRSSPGPNAGALDPEFEAFQAGHAGPPPPDFLHAPHPPQPLHFGQPQQAPNWAADFQRLNISSPPPQRAFQPAPSNAAASWHQDFMRQQVPVQAPALQQNNYGAMPSYGMGSFVGSAFRQSPFDAMNGAHMSGVAQGKQRAQEAVPEFDEAAFEAAFAQAQQDMLEESMNMDTVQHQPDVVQQARELPAETDPILSRIKDSRPSVYLAIKIRSEVDSGRFEESIPFLTELESIGTSGRLTEDASESKWVADALQKIVDREAPQEIKTRAEHLITTINERLMTAYPLLGSNVPLNQDNIWQELEFAGYTTRSPVPDHEHAQQEPEQQEQPLRNDDDEMAETAGRLLERVADNTSEKFQNSQFLELMRRLRDREVRVEGDKMVEVSNAQSSSSSSQLQQHQQPQMQPQPQHQYPATTIIPEIPTADILSSAALDFSMPMDSEETSTPTTTSMPGTTETSQIPRHEQDLDLGRSGVPGLDPSPPPGQHLHSDFSSMHGA